MALSALPKLKALGQRGSWFATVAGEELPCVHSKHMRDGRYNDPAFDPLSLQWQGFADAIKRGRVILTKGVTQPESGTEDRKGYVAIFRVDDVSTDDGCLRFHFLERLQELE
jgi:hypothetical protein